MRALLVQAAPTPGDLSANAARAAEIVRSAPDVDLVLLPELYLGGYDLEAARRHAVAVDDPVLEPLRAAAEQAGTAVLIGMAERLPDGAAANSLLAIDERGRTAAVYRKTHLFGGEPGVFEPGDELVVVPLAGRRLGLLICFDIEFPEPARALAHAGADVLVAAVANMDPYERDHELASRARALDNRLPLLYANRVGRESGLTFVGRTRAVSPDGEVVAQAGRDGEELLTVDVPPMTVGDELVDYLAQVRDDLPVSVKSAGGEI
ncbi:MAG: hypothetical protein LT070_14215 [Solirubrobacteraceae bacterium]|nr:hypothetical protein [Solirubrobacteraceae bacterium]